MFISAKVFFFFSSRDITSTSHLKFKAKPAKLAWGISAWDMTPLLGMWHHCMVPTASIINITLISPHSWALGRSPPHSPSHPDYFCSQYKCNAFTLWNIWRAHTHKSAQKKIKICCNYTIKRNPHNYFWRYTWFLNMFLRISLTSYHFIVRLFPYMERYFESVILWLKRIPSNDALR